MKKTSARMLAVTISAAVALLTAPASMLASEVIVTSGVVEGNVTLCGNGRSGDGNTGTNEFRRSAYDQVEFGELGEFGMTGSDDAALRTTGDSALALNADSSASTGGTVRLNSNVARVEGNLVRLAGDGAGMASNVCGGRVGDAQSNAQNVLVVSGRHLAQNAVRGNQLEVTGSIVVSELSNFSALTFVESNGYGAEALDLSPDCLAPLSGGVIVLGAGRNMGCGEVMVG